jgi:Zn-dependent protease with chaperone function
MDTARGVPAQYFDGRSTALHHVMLVLAAGRVTVTGEALHRDEPLEAVEIPPALGRTPRLVRFPDGAFCEVNDHAAFAAMLAGSGVRAPAISSWESSPRTALLAVALIAGCGWLVYVFGLPALAGAVARRMPDATVITLGNHTLRMLDSQVFEPTALPDSRVSGIVTRLLELRWPGDVPPLDLQFRRSDALGPNALALPSGTIVVTDALVALAADDREVLAVLAHEVAHVEQRHGLRNMLQASAVTLLITWYVGDISALAVAAPAALLQTRYSRDFERQADAYAVQALQLNGIPVSFFADMLAKIEGRTPTEQASGGALPYLSTHPTTAERLERLKAAGEGRR